MDTVSIKVTLETCWKWSRWNKLDLHSLTALIFATSILLLFSCSESTEDTTKVIAESPLTGTIQGQITPGGSHAMVELIKDNQVIHSIAVDKEDKYFITHLTFGIYQIKITAKGYRSVEPTTTVNLQQAQLNLDLQLQPNGSEVGDLAPDFHCQTSMGTRLPSATTPEKRACCWHSIEASSDRFVCHNWYSCYYQTIRRLILSRPSLSLSINQSVNENRAVSEQYKLPYPCLSDPGADAIRGYNVLDFANVPKVAFFVIDKAGRIHWRSTHSGGDPGDLPKINDLLDVLRKIQWTGYGWDFFSLFTFYLNVVVRSVAGLNKAGTGLDQHHQLSFRVPYLVTN